MAHAQKPDFVFRQNGRVHFNWRGHQFSRLPAAEVCASVVVMLDTPCFEVVWTVLATHSIHQFSLLCVTAITFQLDSTNLTSPPVCHCVPSHFNWTVLLWRAMHRWEGNIKFEYWRNSACVCVCVCVCNFLSSTSWYLKLCWFVWRFLGFVYLSW
jgi:hypothetical protein